jgi:hypothetical protein
MIVFDLKCRRDHVFEAWFKSGSAYESQRAAGKIACPECGSAKITKAPMAPRLARRQEIAPRQDVAVVDHETAASSEAAGAGLARETLRRLRRTVEANCENVGDRFAEEARKIHYGETARRDIYGEASDDDAVALADEGVEFHRLPWPREDA